MSREPSDGRLDRAGPARGHARPDQGEGPREAGGGPRRRGTPREIEGRVERLIREAQEEGAFERLPGAGQPLPLSGGELPEAWWIKEKLRREELSVMPEAVAIRREAEQVLASLAAIQDERVVRERLETLDARIRLLNRTHVSGPPTTLAPLDIEGVLRRWRADRQAASPTGPSGPAVRRR